MNGKRYIYADCAAQARPRPEAVAAAENALRLYGNPSGVHSCAKNSARLIFEARRSTAQAISARPSEIYFTGSATEANNMAIYSAAAYGAANGRMRMLVFAGEHHSVLRPAESIARRTGMTLELIPCRADGAADIAALEKMCAQDVCLCALMHVNNETGVIQPVTHAAAAAHRHGIRVLTDASQSVGHIPVDVNALGCDYLTLSAHKFGGISGAGVLWCRNGIAPEPLVLGGGQERGRRAGTEALPAICAMGAAVGAAVSAMNGASLRIASLRQRLEQQLAAHPRIHVIGAEAPRTASILCVCVEGADGEQLALQLDREGICVSSGAACTTGDESASHVLSAMGIDGGLAKGALRFSLDTELTEPDVDYISEALLHLIN